MNNKVPTHAPSAVLNSFPTFALRGGWERAGRRSEMKWIRAETTMRWNESRHNKNRRPQAVHGIHVCLCVAGADCFFRLEAPVLVILSLCPVVSWTQNKWSLFSVGFLAHFVPTSPARPCWGRKKRVSTEVYAFAGARSLSPNRLIETSGRGSDRRGLAASSRSVIRP